MEINKFKVQSKYKPAGDQIKAISELVKGFREGKIIRRSLELLEVVRPLPWLM